MTADLHVPPATPDAFARRYWRTTTPADAVLAPLGAAPQDAEFRLLADGLPTLCWMARGDGYIVWYNRRCLDYTGMTAEALEGWGWAGVQDPGEHPHIRATWEKAIAAGEAFEMVLSLRGADGRTRPFLTRISPCRDAGGQVARWFGVNIEVGAQMQAESALQLSDARFDVLTDAMPQMVWSTRADGFNDYYNARWFAFTGMTPGSVDGEGWVDMVHPDDQARTWSRWRRSLDSGEPYEIEYRLRHHTGEYRWGLGRALPVRDARGAITRWIGTCTDIHDAKLAAERNELLSRELSHRGGRFLILPCVAGEGDRRRRWRGRAERGRRRRHRRSPGCAGRPLPAFGRTPPILRIGEMRCAEKCCKPARAWRCSTGYRPTAARRWRPTASACAPPACPTTPSGRTCARSRAPSSSRGSRPGRTTT
jgi:PAS domain S-box-containing protein